MTQIVESKRIQYTASSFGKNSLIYLQEVGFSKALKQHISSRDYMASYLFFIVLEGSGSLTYNNEIIKLKQNDCVFIDCHKPYKHSSDNWNIAFIHFYGGNIKDIYNKYLDRNGKNVFNTKSSIEYNQLINDIFLIAQSNDYIKDMTIYNKLINILHMIMSETIYPEDNKRNNKYDLNEIKKYLDDNYTRDISLDLLSNKFYINKYYLTRAFKDNYGQTINNYLVSKKITKAKELLRFSDLDINQIGINCGIKDPNYFSRLFKKVEGITPKEYARLWK